MPLSRKPIANDDTVVFGSPEAWNVADGYMKLKVLKFLIDADRYEIISIYGLETMDNTFLPEDVIVPRRIEGIHRLKDTLKIIMANANFALKNEDKIKMETHRKRILEVEKVLNGIYGTETNYATNQTQIVIKEEFFNKCLNILQDVKEKINSILNNAGLIFRAGEEIDLEKLEEEIIKGG